MKNVYQVDVEVAPMHGTQLPRECAGAFVNVYVGADDIRAAIDAVEKKLLQDRYKPVCTRAAFVLDPSEPDCVPEEEGFPGTDDLTRIRNAGEIWYGPFNCFPPDDQNSKGE